MERPEDFYVVRASESGNVFSLTGPVATIHSREDQEVVGTISQSFRNEADSPGRPVWWFCPTKPPIPVAESDVSEADIIDKAIAWLRGQSTGD